MDAKIIEVLDRVVNDLSTDNYNFERDLLFSASKQAATNPITLHILRYQLMPRKVPGTDKGASAKQPPTSPIINYLIESDLDTFRNELGKLVASLDIFIRNRINGQKFYVESATILEGQMDTDNITKVIRKTLEISAYKLTNAANSATKCLNNPDICRTIMLNYGVTPRDAARMGTVCSAFHSIMVSETTDKFFWRKHYLDRFGKRSDQGESGKLPNESFREAFIRLVLENRVNTHRLHFLPYWFRTQQPSVLPPIIKPFGTKNKKSEPDYDDDDAPANWLQPRPATNPTPAIIQDPPIFRPGTQPWAPMQGGIPPQGRPRIVGDPLEYLPHFPGHGPGPDPDLPEGPNRPRRGGFGGPFGGGPGGRGGGFGGGII